MRKTVDKGQLRLYYQPLIDLNSGKIAGIEALAVDDPSDSAIVRSILAIAHSLNVRVVAEGVETQAQLEYLRSMKWSIENSLQCDQVQGFLFSRPVPATEFMELFIR